MAKLYSDGRLHWEATNQVYCGKLCGQHQPGAYARTSVETLRRNTLCATIVLQPVSGSALCTCHAARLALRIIFEIVEPIIEFIFRLL